jgi:hypothetical protein
MKTSMVERDYATGVTLPVISRLSSIELDALKDWEAWMMARYFG